MQRYMWPGYKMQLLAELQKQQNNTQFCDTLLQTEGISIPAHSCILAALSPYLSRKLSGSTSPPLGQKHQLQLRALKAQTLLKLVGLLYSGELEVKGSVERNDVLSAARELGITDLVEGQNWQAKEREPQEKGSLCSEDKEEGCKESNERQIMQEAHAQFDSALARSAVSLTEERSCVSRGTQTIAAREKAVSSSFTHSRQTKASTQELASSLPHSTLQPQNISLDQNLCSSSCPSIPFMLSEASTDGASSLKPSSDSVTNPTSTSASSENVMALQFFLDDGLSSATTQEYIACQQSSEGPTNGKMADDCENTEELNLHIHKEDPRRGATCNSKEKRQDHANSGLRSLARMKQMQKMMEATQISIKVKLRRRTEEEVWEVVNMQDSNETLAVLASLQQDGCNNKRQQTDHANDVPPSTSVQPDSVSKPKSPPPQPATSNSTEPPPPPSDTTSNCQIQDDGLEQVPLPQPSGQVEDSDEQIEKLLEDIMMGLNILPSLARDPKKPHLLQPTNDRASAPCRIQPSEDDGVTSHAHAAAAAVGAAAVCGCCHDLGTQIGLSSPETGIHCCFTLQSQPSCSSLSSVQSDAVPAQQQPPSSPQDQHYVTSMSQRSGPRHQDLSLSKSQNPSQEVPTGSVIPVALYFSGTTIHYPEVNLHKSSQEDQKVLEILPRTNGTDAPSSLPVLVPCMDDFRFPPCLSPLESSSSAAKHQYNFSNPTSHSDKIQLHRPPWLTENPGSLQYPLIASTHITNPSGSSPRDMSGNCWEKCQHTDRIQSPQTGGTCADSDHVNEQEAILEDHQNVEEGKSPPKKMKEVVRRKLSDSKEVTRRRKRRRKTHLQGAVGYLSNNQVNDSDATQGQFNLSVCSVSLSSNNVLAKEREQATGSLNVPDNPAGKPNEPSNTPENLKEKTREPCGRMRTRGFLKQDQDIANNTSPQHASVLKTIDHHHQASIVNKQCEPSLKRKRGRPPKVDRQKHPEISHVKTEQKDDSAKNEPNNSLSKEEEGKKAERECRKRRRNPSQVGIVPLKKTPSAESTGTTEKDLNNNNVSPAGRKPKQPRMVTLKEFQKLFRHRHLKTSMSEESQDKKIYKTARKEEKDANSFPSSACEELTQKTEVDFIQPENTEGMEESHCVFDVTVDKNHNQILNNESHKDDTHICTGKEASLLGEEQRSVFCSVSGEDVEELAAEREQPLVNLHEAPKCDEAVPTQWTINIDGASHNDSIRPLDHNINLQTLKRTGLPLMDADGCKKSSGSDEKGANEEEEVEVDVLLCSPGKGPETRHYENGQENVDFIPEEEEEEDVNEIDVTGDEAE